MGGLGVKVENIKITFRIAFQTAKRDQITTFTELDVLELFKTQLLKL